jgi:metacaspase-1
MPKGLSLHVGLNEIDPAHYGSDGALNACVSDAEAMRDLAKAQGFQVMNVFTNSQATRAAVKAGIEEAAKKLKAGDIFLYTYSGHGSQTPDLNKDEEEQGDTLDETWCLYDGMFIDDEAYELWKNFAPGVRVLVLLDCCHSGTAIKVAPGC